MPEAHRRYFNSIAEKWDQRQLATARLKDIVKRCAILPGMQVLDVGAGTGCLSRFLAEAVGSTGRVVAMDIAERMLMRAATKPELAKVNFFCSNATALAFHNTVFDVVMCFAVFPHFVDKVAALTEFYRVLKPNGHLYIAHLMGSTQMNQHHHNIGGVVGNDVLPNSKELQHMLVQVNFSEISIIDQTEIYFASAKKSTGISTMRAFTSAG